ncbi:hypothetical protein ASC90_17435 [Rhizobium sp. Root1220]|nr:hypothetical protein ASC90_17435 [Rhizobium sp. Root1220]
MIEPVIFAQQALGYAIFHARPHLAARQFVAGFAGFRLVVIDAEAADEAVCHLGLPVAGSIP